MTARDVAIRPARRRDAQRLGRLMTEGLRTRFSYLGESFVALLHAHMADSRHCICVVAEHNGQVIGYAAALTSGSGFYREFLIRKGLLGALLALPRMFRISSIRTVYTALTYFPASAHEDPEAELVSIVVDPSAQGLGVASRLWDGIVAGLRERGIPELKICTGVGNERANRMYEKRGCRLIRREPLYHDTEVNVYIYRVLPWPS